MLLFVRNRCLLYREADSQAKLHEKRILLIDRYPRPSQKFASEMGGVTDHRTESGQEICR